MEAKKDEYYQARNLYFGTTMTQQQIAEMLKINRKTLQRWIDEGAWKQARYAASHAPMVLTEQYYHQLGMLNKEIAERTDRPYATKEESEIIKRLTSTVKTFDKGKPGVVQTIEVFTAFTDTLLRKEKEFDVAKAFMQFMDIHVGHLMKDGDQLPYGMIKLAQEEEDKEYTDWKTDHDKPKDPPKDPPTDPPQDPESPSPTPEPLPPTPPSKPPTPKNVTLTTTPPFRAGVSCATQNTTPTSTPAYVTSPSPLMEIMALT